MIYQKLVAQSRSYHAKLLAKLLALRKSVFRRHKKTKKPCEACEAVSLEIVAHNLRKCHPAICEGYEHPPRFARTSVMKSHVLLGVVTVGIKFPRTRILKYYKKHENEGPRTNLSHLHKTKRSEFHDCRRSGV